jgi:hypothetical protein
MRDCWELQPRFREDHRTANAIHLPFGVGIHSRKRTSFKKDRLEKS